MQFVFNIYFDLKLSNRPILPTMYFCEDISVSISDTLKIYYEIDRIFSKFHVGNLCINRCRISEFNTILVNRFINLTNLEIRNCSITSLKIGAFDSLIHLQNINLSNNNISNIDESIFADNVNLRTINLSNNKLIIVNKSVFKNLLLLENLDLSFNKIRILDPLFLNNEPLKQLKLQNNLIYEISDTAFDNLINLSSLDLTRNNLGNLNSKVFLKTTKMVTLFLSDNLLTYISTDAFSSMDDLLVLHLQDNRIKYIDNRFSKNSNLATLNLGNNKIQCLKGNSFAHNKKLKFLKLIVFETFEATLLYHLEHLVCLELLYELDEMSNFLADLVVVLLDKPNLIILRISYKYNYHYDSIERLQVLHNLKDLYVQCLNDDKINREIDISTQLGLLTKLNTLTLKNMNILSVTFPREKGFKSGLKLKCLDLTGIKNSLISDVFSDHPFLEYLNLSFSLVSEISENAFVSLAHLTHFYIEHSQLQHVFSTTFLNNVKLKVINFANNKIETIDDYTFTHLTSLELLDLRGNLLKNVTPRAYQGLTKNTQIIYK